MSVALKSENVTSFFEKEGYSLCSEYKNCHVKLKVHCPQGHLYEVTWANFQQGYRCPHCVGRYSNNIENVQQKAIQVGYKVLSKVYTNVKSKLEFECPKKHQFQMMWSNFWSLGQRCPICYQINTRGSLDLVCNELAKDGYKVLSNEYINNYTNLEVQCPKGHVFKSTWANLKSGTRCLQCFHDSRRINIDVMRQKIVDENQILLTDGVQDCYTRLQLKCPHGHVYEITWTNFQQGHRCPKCAHFQSLAERDLIDIFSEVIHKEKDRTAIKPKELDLYFPDHKVAVEYCGLYWHSDQHERITPSYHRTKLNLCNQQNIRLLTIFEDEWKEHKDICISRIRSVLNMSINKIQARKCTAKEISKKEAYKFLKRTHLQGIGSCKVAYGLFYNNQLVQVMTFGSPNRAHTSKGKKVLEMKRLAGELGTTVVGGAGKLFKLGLQYAKEHSYEIIKSYCDLRWGTGNLYKKLGFIMTHDSLYSPHYTDGYRRFRNQSLATNKKKEGMSESVKANQKQLYRIYDCGHQTWEYEICK